MRAYILKTDVKIDPFGDYARDCLIGNKPLQQLQAETLRAAGLEPIYIDDLSEITDPNEYIVLEDNLYLTVELLLDFIAQSRQMKIRTVCALKSGDITLRTAVDLQRVTICDSHVRYGLYYYTPRDDRNNFQIVLIDPDELHASIPMPAHMCGADSYTIPVTDKCLIQIDHWVNLWWANLVTVLANGARLQKSPKWKLLLLALKARSFNKWKISRATNKIGRNCDIHPTAYIEGSVIGDRVILGAGAIVRNSIIGYNTSIGNSVVIEESVIGGDCVIMNGRVLFSVMYPRSFSVSGLITASIVGRESFSGLHSTMTDFRFDNKNVMVIKDGKLVDSGNRFLGSCLGHGVYLGSGCVIAPGRMIPNGVHLTLTPDRIIRGCSDGQSDIEGYRIV